MSDIKGHIHSFQSLGAVDGPGLRFVVFMQGCGLRCAYCHNPDTWKMSSDSAIICTVDEVVEKISRYTPYFENSNPRGGVTVSGGEPLLQCEFVSELFGSLKKLGIHTALDTSGICGELCDAEKVLDNTDLVICDVKFDSNEGYRLYSSSADDTLDRVKCFLDITEKKNIPLWIRHVVVPGITDMKSEVLGVYGIAKKYRNLEKFELLPFRKICHVKYDALGIPFPLAQTSECGKDKIDCLYRMLDN